MSKYRTVVVDPPWDHSDGTGASYSLRGRRSCALPYQTLTLDEIKDLPVDVLAAPDASLFLWTTNRYLRSSFDVVDAWGFNHVATLVWCKQRGLGSGGVFYSNVEFILYCRRGKVAAPARIHSRWFDWSRSAHSAKPEAFLDIVEAVSPGPYLELFARRNRLGWDTWGNQAFEHVAVGSVMVSTTCTSCDGEGLSKQVYQRPTGGLDRPMCKVCKGTGASPTAEPPANESGTEH